MDYALIIIQGRSLSVRFPNWPQSISTLFKFCDYYKLDKINCLRMKAIKVEHACTALFPYTDNFLHEKSKIRRNQEVIILPHLRTMNESGQSRTDGALDE